MVTNNASAASSQTGATQAHEGAENLIHMVQDYTSGGALGFMDRVGDAMNQRFNEMYSSENMHKVMEKVLDNLPPEIREGLSQLFNALSGALSGNEPAKSQEYETIKEVYGTGGTDNESVRMNSNFAQRDDAQFAAAVTIGNGSGAITEVNGIQYVNGKPVNDGDDDAAEFAEQVEAMSEAARERAWDESMHSVAGMNLTGEEIDSIVDFMNDPVQRQKMIERRAKEKGISEQQAAEEVDRGRRLLELEKKSYEGTLTAAEKQELPQLRNDSVANDAARAGAKARSDLYGSPDHGENVSRAADNNVDSTSLGADLLDSQFANAPPVREHFVAANTATQPLDTQPAQNNPRKLEIAQGLPTNQAASGFNI